MRITGRSVCWTNGQCGQVSFFSNVLCPGLDYENRVRLVTQKGKVQGMSIMLAGQQTLSQMSLASEELKTGQRGCRSQGRDGQSGNALAVIRTVDGHEVEEAG